MPKRIPAEEFEMLSELIEGYPDGLSISRLRHEVPNQLSDRMLQHRLKALAKEGRITTRGRGKGLKYYPANVYSEDRLSDSEVSATDEVVPLSRPARAIRNRVRAPLGARTPVGYNAGFLDDYVPNESAYLTESIRQDLIDHGKVGITGLPAGTYARQVMNRLLIDLSWNSSRLEGNTYSLLETERLIEFGESAEGKAAKDTQMILNHKAAIEMLADLAEEIGFNRYTLCNLHALLSDNLLADPSACGRLRTLAVGIGGTVYHPLEVPQRIEEHFLAMLRKCEAIENPFEQAFFIMVHLPYLQPFEDVNKRVSRLAANIPMIRHNLCPLSFIDIPQDDYVQGLIGVYERNRVEYLRDVFVWAYRRSAARYSAVVQSLGEPDPFRLRFREQIGEHVRDVVIGAMTKKQAARWIQEQVQKDMVGKDGVKFVEVVETELSCLHEGNIARYRLRPREFHDWASSWNSECRNSE